MFQILAVDKYPPPPPAQPIQLHKTELKFPERPPFLFCSVWFTSSNTTLISNTEHQHCWSQEFLITQNLCTKTCTRIQRVSFRNKGRHSNLFVNSAPCFSLEPIHEHEVHFEGHLIAQVNTHSTGNLAFVTNNDNTSLNKINDNNSI